MHKRIDIGNLAFFISVAAIASLVFSFAVRGYFRGYEADVPVVVIPLESGAASGREIAGNLVSFFRTDAFLNQFVDGIGEQRIFGSKYPTGSDRRDRFARMFSIELYPDGSMVSIRAISKRSEEAEYLSRQAALSLFRFSSQYYNVKTGADFRIVGAPRAEEVTTDMTAFVAVSLSLGFGVSGLLFLIFSMWPNRSVITVLRDRETPLFDTRIFEPRRPVSPILQEEISGHDVPVPAVPPEYGERADSETVPQPADEPLPEKTAVREQPRVGDLVHGRKAAAPMNLPGLTEAEAQFLREFEFENQEGNDALEGFSDTSASVATTETTETPITEAPVAEREIPGEPDMTQNAEPTKEEYKRRLNDLLRG